MKTTLALAAALLWAAPAWAGEAPFKLPPLPYPPEALEPHIDRQTMEIHHGRHHRAYVDNLNAQVAAYPELGKLSLEALQGSISKFNAAVRNNGGGHYNHDLFWKLLSPPGKGGAPSRELSAAIERDFGSLDQLKERFGQAAATRFGSGWAWLIVTPAGRLAVTSTPNQDNPLMDLVEERGTPLLALDVWEHAYYLKYMNRRGDYIAAFWNLVRWDEVNRRFAQTTAR
jgi:Fe-Mn family superoxide dismutase